MVTRQEIENDNRFFINSVTLTDILRRVNIKRYELRHVKIGRLRHNYGKLMAIYETIPYKFLDNPTDEKCIKDYLEYCDIPSAKKDNPDRSIDCYNNLMNHFSVEEYNIQKGIIVIDQFYKIQEGLHRSCILLKKYGSQHKVQVLYIVTTHNFFSWIKSYIRMIVFDIKHFTFLK